MKYGDVKRAINQLNELEKYNINEILPFMDEEIRQSYSSSLLINIRYFRGLLLNNEISAVFMHMKAAIREGGGTAVIGFYNSVRYYASSRITVLKVIWEATTRYYYEYEIW